MSIQYNGCEPKWSKQLAVRTTLIRSKLIFREVENGDYYLIETFGMPSTIDRSRISFFMEYWKCDQIRGLKFGIIT